MSRLARLFTSVALAATLTGGAVATTATPALATGNEVCTAIGVGVITVNCVGNELITVAGIDVNILNVKFGDVLNFKNSFQNFLNNNLSGNLSDNDIYLLVKDFLNDNDILNCTINVNVLSNQHCSA